MLANTSSRPVFCSFVLIAILVFILSVNRFGYIKTQLGVSQGSAWEESGKIVELDPQDDFSDDEHVSPPSRSSWSENLLQAFRHHEKPPPQKEDDENSPVTSNNKTSASPTKEKPTEPANIYESLKQHAINNTVMIVPVNEGMLVFAENMICSLHKINFNPQNIVFWTLDDKSGEQLRNRGLHTFHDPSMFGVSDYVGFDYNSPEFRRMMTERPKFLINVLSTGLDILFLDTDIVFYDDPLKLVDPAVDLMIGSDSRDFFEPDRSPFQDPGSKGDRMPPVCAGTFWMKSNEHNIALLQIMSLTFQSDPSVVYLREEKGLSDDQRGFDVLLNDGRANLVEPLPGGITAEMMDGKRSDDATLKVRILDQAWVASGHLFRNQHDAYQRHLAALEEGGGKKLLIHLNWNSVDKPKIEGAKELGIWQLDEEGKCM